MFTGYKVQRLEELTHISKFLHRWVLKTIAKGVEEPVEANVIYPT